MNKQLKEMTQFEKQVFMLLPMGASTLISTQDIQNILDIDERHVRGIIERLIFDYGIPIGSMRDKRHGYFIAETEEEKRAGIASLKQQTETMQKRAEKVKEADLSIAKLYKKKYQHQEPPHSKQLDLLYYLNNDVNKDEIEV